MWRRWEKERDKKRLARLEEERNGRVEDDRKAIGEILKIRQEFDARKEIVDKEIKEIDDKNNEQDSRIANIESQYEALNKKIEDLEKNTNKSYTEMAAKIPTEIPT